MKKIGLLFTVLIFPGVLSAQDNLSLDQCRRLSLEHNQKIRMAKQQVQAAGEVRRSAFTQYLPSFSLNGAYTYLNKDFRLLKNDMFLPVVPYSAIDPSTGQLSSSLFTDPVLASSAFVIDPSTGTVATDASGNPIFRNYTYLPASGSEIDIDNVYLLNGGFTQPLYLGGKIREANKIARYTQEIAEYNLSLTEDELLYSVEETYWRIISLGEKVKLAGQYQEMLSRLVSDLENIHSEGIITENDLLKARLKQSEVDILALKATNGMEISKMVLCQMTGIQYSSSVTLSDSLNTSDFSIQGLVVDESEISERPELQILEKNVQIAMSGVKIMQSRYLPDIVLSAGYTFANPNPYAGFSNEFGSDYTVGIAFDIPVFHFGDRMHTLNAARYEKSIADLKLEETRELIVLQLQQAVYRYNEATRKTEYAELALQQASMNLSFTEDNFNEGILKSSDLLEAQALWQSAYSELIDARTELQMAASNLKKVTGKY